MNYVNFLMISASMPFEFSQVRRKFLMTSRNGKAQLFSDLLSIEIDMDASNIQQITRRPEASDEMLFHHFEINWNFSFDRYLSWPEGILRLLDLDIDAQWENVDESLNYSNSL